MGIFSVVFIFSLSCGGIEERPRKASPELIVTAELPDDIGQGTWYIRITATPKEGAPPTHTGSFHIGSKGGITFAQESYSLSLLSDAANDTNVGTPITASAPEGVTVSYTLASCMGFKIDMTSAQISTSAANPMAGTRNCMVTATGGGYYGDGRCHHNRWSRYRIFAEASYSFSVLSNAAANFDVGTVMATSSNGPVSYALDMASCAGFQVNAMGQISTWRLGKN